MSRNTRIFHQNNQEDKIYVTVDTLKEQEKTGKKKKNYSSFFSVVCTVFIIDDQEKS